MRVIMHGRSRMTIDPRLPTMPGRSRSGFDRPDRMLTPGANRREVSGESDKGRGEAGPAFSKVLGTR